MRILTLPKREIDAYKRNARRISDLEAVRQEYLTFLVILYGEQIESGTKSVRDYGKYTMADMQSEIILRQTMYTARIHRKQKELRVEYATNETALLEELKNM
jgi:hypothetical protein